MHFSLFAVQKKKICEKGGCDLIFSCVILSLLHTGLVVTDTLHGDLHLYSANFFFFLLLYLFLFIYICMHNAVAGVFGWQIFLRTYRVFRDLRCVARCALGT